MIAIQTGDVDIGALIAAAKKQGTGAVVVFDGVVRDDEITEMELEAYEEVAVKELEKIAQDATGRFRLLHVDIIHRIGRLAVGENILIIVVSAGHRPEAYAGSRYIIEEIKKGVPIWKKELTSGVGGCLVTTGMAKDLPEIILKFSGLDLSSPTDWIFSPPFLPLNFPRITLPP